VEVILYRLIDSFRTSPISNGIRFRVWLDFMSVIMSKKSKSVTKALFLCYSYDYPAVNLLPFSAKTSGLNKIYCEIFLNK
jgi:hypothetical protein